MKRFKAGDHIVVHDMPGYLPNPQDGPVTLETITHILDGRIPDKDDVSIRTRKVTLGIGIGLL